MLRNSTVLISCLIFKDFVQCVGLFYFVAGEHLSTLVERLPDLDKVSILLRSHYHWGSWTWCIILCMWCLNWRSTESVHDHGEQQNEAWQLSWTYRKYLASRGSNYTWIWMYLLEQFAVNFVRLSNHALAGAYKPFHGAKKFLSMIFWEYVPQYSYFSAWWPSE